MNQKAGLHTNLVSLPKALATAHDSHICHSDANDGSDAWWVALVGVMVTSRSPHSQSLTEMAQKVAVCTQRMKGPPLLRCLGAEGILRHDAVQSGRREQLGRAPRKRLRTGGLHVGRRELSRASRSLEPRISRLQLGRVSRSLKRCAEAEVRGMPSQGVQTRQYQTAQSGQCPSSINIKG